MGRELQVYRMDFLKDGTAIIRANDYNLCGRTEFTNEIASQFYGFDKSISALLIAPERFEHCYKDGKLVYNWELFSTVKTVHVKVEDDCWDEKEFDLDYSFVKASNIKDIINECQKEDDMEYQRELNVLEDARLARQHTTTLKDFNDFSELIDKLTNHMKRTCFTEAIDYGKEIARISTNIEQAWDNMPEGIVESYVLLYLSE